MFRYGFASNSVFAALIFLTEPAPMVVSLSGTTPFGVLFPPDVSAVSELATADVLGTSDGTAEQGS